MIRPARADDVPVIYQLTRDLADYERSLQHVSATEDDLRQSLMAAGANVVIESVADLIPTLSREKAAKMLGISMATLYRKVEPKSKK